jgi:hypothetical protein
MVWCFSKHRDNIKEKNQVCGEILTSPTTDLYQTQFVVHRAGVCRHREEKAVNWHMLLHKMAVKFRKTVLSFAEI